MLDDLKAFIQTSPDALELKRATAVAMVLEGYKHREIAETLSVSSGFITKWRQRYELLGVSGLKLGPLGSIGYLKREQRQAILVWLQSKEEWDLAELQAHLQTQYGVVFEARHSYYNLFKQAGVRWRKLQPRKSKTNPVVGTSDRAMAKTATEV